VATSDANKIRAGLLAALQSDLPAKLSYLGLTAIATWESRRREIQHTGQLPAIAIRWNGWQQSQDSGVGIAQDDTYVERWYRFVVLVAIHEDDPEDADYNLAAYADAVAAVLDDYANMTLGGAAQDISLNMTCDVTPGLRIEGFSQRVRVAGIEIAVKRGRTVGSYI